MPIASDFSISTNGDIRHVSGTDVYTVLDLHAWLQDLADDASATGNDLLDILAPNPSSHDGKRRPANPSKITLNSYPAAGISFNLDDDAAQYIKFGSIEQGGGQVLYSGLISLGAIDPASPIYLVQNGAKLPKYWPDGPIQIIVKVRSGGTLIDNGEVTAFSRKWGFTYSSYTASLAAGGENVVALATGVDKSIVLTEAQAALLSSKVTVTFGDVTRDLGNGNGLKLYKGTITLSGGCTVQEAYQYLQYLTRENSTATLNGVPGWRYRKLNASYPEIAAAPFGTFGGGTLFLAQGWWIDGVLPSEATRYELIAHDGTAQVPPTLVGITVGNLVSGDRVLVARENGTGGILKDEYTPVAASAGATSLTVVESIKTDTPSSGVIRIKNLRYMYSSFNAGTKTFSGLSPALASNIVAADEVFVPFVDVATTSTAESVSFIYASNFTARVDVRNGSGVSPIVPFTTLISVGSAGASVNASRNSDV